MTVIMSKVKGSEYEANKLFQKYDCILPQSEFMKFMNFCDESVERAIH